MKRLLLAAVAAFGLHAALGLVKLPTAHDPNAYTYERKAVNIRIIRSVQHDGHEDPAPDVSEKPAENSYLQDHANPPKENKVVASPGSRIAHVPLKGHKRDAGKEKQNKVKTASSTLATTPPPEVEPKGESHSSAPEASKFHEAAVGEPKSESIPHAPEVPVTASLDAGGKITAAGASFVDATPSYLANPPPAYPLIAKKKGYEGTVVLEVFVDEKGSAQGVKVFVSSGYQVLDLAALEAVSNWRFHPALKGGMPTGTSIKVPVVFKLE